MINALSLKKIVICAAIAGMLSITGCGTSGDSGGNFTLPDSSINDPDNSGGNNSDTPDNPDVNDNTSGGGGSTVPDDNPSVTPGDNSTGGNPGVGDNSTEPVPDPYMPEAPLTDIAAASVNDRIYYFFGLKDDSLTKISVYDTKSDTWSVSAPTGYTNAVVSSATGVSVGNNIYLLFGDLIEPAGSGATVSFVQNMYIYDTVSNITVKKPFSGPKGRSGHASVASGDKIYIFGGYNNGRSLNDLWQYDTISSSWKQASSVKAPSARSDPGMVAYNNKIYIFGGRAGSMTNDFYEYDPSANSWSKLTALNSPEPRQHVSLAVLGDYIYVFGGEDGDYKRLSYAWRINMLAPTLSWEKVEDIADFGSGSYIRPVTIGDAIYIFYGGAYNKENPNHKKSKLTVYRPNLP